MTLKAHSKGSNTPAVALTYGSLEKGVIMTICVCVKSRDGVVLGTDSMTQVILPAQDGTFGVAKAYNNARKLYQIGDLPIGVMTWGAANIGARTISGLILEFSRNTKANNVKEVVEGLAEHIHRPYDEAFKSHPEGQRPILGLYAAGYSKSKSLPEEWEYLFPAADKPKLVRGIDGFGAAWRGIDLPFTRLHFGFDPRMGQKLLDAGVDKKILDPVFEQLEFQAAVAFDAMPVQDAINFAAYCLRTQ